MAVVLVFNPEPPVSPSSSTSYGGGGGRTFVSGPKSPKAGGEACSLPDMAHKGRWQGVLAPTLSVRAESPFPCLATSENSILDRFL